MTSQCDALTLSVHRIIEAPRTIVWQCWTDPAFLKPPRSSNPRVPQTPAFLKQWHCPKSPRIPD